MPLQHKYTYIVSSLFALIIAFGAFTTLYAQDGNGGRLFLPIVQHGNPVEPVDYISLDDAAAPIPKSEFYAMTDEQIQTIIDAHTQYNGPTISAAAAAAGGNTFFPADCDRHGWYNWSKYCYVGKSGNKYIRKGNSVLAIQRILYCQGYSMGMSMKEWMDGYYGKNTSAELGRWQHDHGLSRDTIVGPLTWTKLRKQLRHLPRDSDSTHKSAYFAYYHVGDPEYCSPSSPSFRRDLDGDTWEVRNANLKWVRISVPRDATSTDMILDGSTVAKNMVKVALTEHAKWEYGVLKEWNSTVRGKLNAYWNGVGRSWWTTSDAWSSAFISWAVRKAGAGDQFKYHSTHGVYIADARGNRNRGDESKMFWAYRMNEVEPRPGDLVCRQYKGRHITYDTVSGQGAHCDIVTDITSNKATLIGGNVGNSVNTRTYRLVNGKITSATCSKCIAVVRARR